MTTPADRISDANHSHGAERLFLAIDLSPQTRAALAAALQTVPLPGRPVPVSNLHLTVRFLGDTEPARRDRLISALEGAKLGRPFDFTLAGAGAFPRPARATTLWLATTTGAAELHVLAQRTENAVQEAGFPPDRRPFRGHLTIARIRTPEDVRPLLNHLGTISIDSRVTELVLFRSTLGSGPPRYDSLARFPL